MRISDWSSDVCSSDLFTRYAPLNLGAHRLAVSKHIYNIAMSCRMASQRGVRLADELQSEEVLAVQRVASDWTYSLLEELEANERSRSEEHTSELQSIMSISYAVFGLKKKKNIR